MTVEKLTNLSNGFAEQLMRKLDIEYGATCTIGQIDRVKVAEKDFGAAANLTADAWNVVGTLTYTKVAGAGGKQASLMHKFRIVYEYTGGTESPVWDGLQIKIKSERTAGQTVLFYKLGAADPGATTSDSEFELYAPFVAEDGDEIEFAVFLASTGDRTTNKFTIYSEKEIQAILVA